MPQDVFGKPKKLVDEDNALDLRYRQLYDKQWNHFQALIKPINDTYHEKLDAINSEYTQKKKQIDSSAKKNPSLRANHAFEMDALDNWRNAQKEVVSDEYHDKNIPLENKFYDERGILQAELLEERELLWKKYGWNAEKEYAYSKKLQSKLEKDDEAIEAIQAIKPAIEKYLKQPMRESELLDEVDKAREFFGGPKSLKRAKAELSAHLDSLDDKIPSLKILSSSDGKSVVTIDTKGNVVSYGEAHIHPMTNSERSEAVKSIELFVRENSPQTIKKDLENFQQNYLDIYRKAGKVGDAEVDVKAILRDDGKVLLATDKGGYEVLDTHHISPPPTQNSNIKSAIDTKHAFKDLPKR